ncbi:MAG: alpha/beta hydrolase [Limosilactobacillus sp.]|uniref:alpha/beta fold hydrolase n=1 Tax=Limosilactobacillus sp. TaxID=2773925 RepID=UPI0026FA0BB7|nr:alpha/beta hydrolase [Limosilactobacillus sp.]
MGYIDTKNLYVNVKGKEIAYRELGKGNSEYPLVMLVHLAATLDQWDPELLDLLAKKNHVVVIDLPGVGGSEGKVAKTIPGMAQQAVDIIDALGYNKINLLGLSMGGMIAQEIVKIEPQLVNRLALTGTAARGGEEVDKVTPKTFSFMFKAAKEKVDPKRYIFYTHDEQGAKEAKIVLDRMNARKDENKDKDIKVISFLRQLRAIKKWGKDKPDDLSFITQPTLIANGEHDMQVPTKGSYELHAKIKDSQLVIYPNAGHGSIFQYADQFAEKLNSFLAE